jgi:hypothetical protein
MVRSRSGGEAVEASGGRTWSCKIERYQMKRPPSGGMRRRRLVPLVTQGKESGSGG